jgi:hypothetical protein
MYRKVAGKLETFSERTIVDIKGGSKLGRNCEGIGILFKASWSEKSFLKSAF